MFHVFSPLADHPARLEFFGDTIERITRLEPIFVEVLLLLSAAKFVIVVMFYMHLKYDHKIFRALFTGPLIVAVVTIVSLLFLFGQIAIRLGGA